jgi:O-antigen/teichoic acid export membrane protein
VEPSPGRTRDGRRAVLANVVGHGVTGLAGVIVLLVIAALHGPEALGRFNLLFAAYLVGSQVATLGLHVSVVRFVAPLTSGPDRTAVFRGAVLAVMGSGGSAALLLVAFRGALTSLLGRPELATGITYVAIGVFLFAVNKVLLASLAAAGAMDAHARLTGARGVLMLGMLAALIVVGATGEDLILVLVLSEVAMLLLLAVATRRVFVGRGLSAQARRWASRHLRFGILGAGSTLLTELNIRIDVLVLALFVDDRAIGVYTFIAALSEAALQLPLVLRTVLGPEVVRAIERRDVTGLQQLVRSTRARLWAAVAVVAVGMVALHPSLVGLLGADDGFRDGRLPLAVLLTGVVIASGYVPFSLTLAQGGRPLAQTALVGGLALINLVGNLLLVPRLGLVGAAAATALANVASIPLLRLMVHRKLGIRL